MSWLCVQAIVQYGGLDDNDLLYFSCADQVDHVSPSGSWPLASYSACWSTGGLTFIRLAGLNVLLLLRRIVLWGLSLAQIRACQLRRPVPYYVPFPTLIQAPGYNDLDLVTII